MPLNNISSHIPGDSEITIRPKINSGELLGIGIGAGLIFIKLLKKRINI